MTGIWTAIRRTLRPLKRSAKVLCRAVPGYIAARNNVYQFSFYDLLLHIREAVCLPKQGTHATPAGEMQRIVIGDQVIYWPAGAGTLELPGLYHEIFAPFSSNPSSYSHPAIDWSALDWVIDAGACEGFFSALAFQHGITKVVAIEPFPDFRQCLLKTFEAQAANGKFVVESAALGSAPGSINLVLNSQYLCTTQIDPDGPSSGLAVPLKTLNDIASDHELRDRGLIKMDIEDAEVEALRGANELLRKSKPFLAIAVYHNYENALRCRDLILKANPTYKVELRGFCGYYEPPRPYMLFAF